MANVELYKHTGPVVFFFPDPCRVSPNNPDAEAVREDSLLNLEVAGLKSQFSETAQAMIHGDLHTGSVMLTQESTQVIYPEFAYYGRMGFDIGAFLGNLMLAYFAQDGHADQTNNRKVYKEWILKTIEDSWNLFHDRFIALGDEHRNGPGDAYLPSIYNNAEVTLLAQKRCMADLFHDTLGFGSAKMIRSIVGVVHVEDFESISNASKGTSCEHRSLDFVKMILKERRKFEGITEVVAAFWQF